MRVLVLNTGSSSLKFSCCDVPSSPDDRIPQQSRSRSTVRTPTAGSLAGFGGRVSMQWRVGAPVDAPEPPPSISDHGEAVRWLLECGVLRDVEAVGHRVVHGGGRFTGPVRLTDPVMAELDDISHLAPLHNPPSLKAIRAAGAVFGPSFPMVAVFDTAFHAAMPPMASVYALPEDLTARHRIRRYGFHGIAHASLAAGYAAARGRALADVNLITLQLGNGCSATAIQGGRSIDTSMGMTPLEGLVMGTRSGDVDPTLLAYVARRESIETETVEQWLNERSGLLGVSGVSSDMRDVLRAAQEGHPRASLAVELFCYRARKYIGAYLAALGGAEAVVFGGGIGERNAHIRARICSGLEWCGVQVDAARNAAVGPLEPGMATCISTDEAGIGVYVVAVDEETAIAQDTVACLAVPW